MIVKMKSTIQIKQISVLIFSLIGFFVCNNHNVFAESLSMTLNGVDAGNELNFDFDKGYTRQLKCVIF